MTTTPPSQRCEHECVCLFFDHDSKIAKHDGTRCMRNAKGYANCYADTRPRTPAPAADHKAPICENCGLDNTTCRMDMAGCLQAQNAAAKAARQPQQCDHLTECQSYDEEEYPFCKDRGTPCRFHNRRRCPDYKSVIHDQVECDVRQGTYFAQQMVSDALGEPIYTRSRPHTSPPAPEAPCPQHKVWQHCPVAGEIARKAREDVLESVLKSLQKKTYWNGNTWCVSNDDISETLESLRSTTQQTEQEQPR